MLVLAESYLNLFDPFAIRFSSDWGIRWYGLSYAMGFLLAWVLVRWMAATRRTLIPLAKVSDFVLFGAVGAVAGGRLGYVIFYEPHLLTEFSGSVPFWGLLALNKGGMASHGGIAGAIAACVLFGRKHGIPMLHLFDVGAFLAPPGLFLGRIANFINAELWGKALPLERQASPPGWSIKYPAELLSRGFDVSRLEGVRGQLAIELGLPASTPIGELVKPAHDALVAGKAGFATLITPHLTAFYPSQLIQALTDGPILFAVMAVIWLRPRKPGVIAAWFLMVYGAMRIATEVFRQPDDGVGLILGLQRGQLLSVGMIVVGAALLIVAVAGRGEAVGGLMGKSK